MNTAIQKELSQSGVLLIKLNRPEVLNAMNKDLIIGLLETFNEIKDDKKVRVIVIVGNGRGFCAGADLSSGSNTFGGFTIEENFLLLISGRNFFIQILNSSLLNILLMVSASARQGERKSVPEGS